MTRRGAVASPRRARSTPAPGGALPPGGAPPALPGVRHRWVDVRGARLHVAEAGAGPPLLLIHGWPQNWWAWRHTIPVLAEHFHVICPDLRGFGWSAAPSSGYGKESLAADMAGLLDRLGVDRAAVVGHDWGGWIAILLAARHADRVERVSGLSIAPPWVPTRAAIAAVPRAWYQLAVAAPALPGVGAALRARAVRALLRAAIPAGPGVSDRDIELLTHGLSEAARDHAAASLYRSFLLREVPQLLAGRYTDDRVECPLLLMVGDRDPVIRPPQLAGLDRHAARGEVVVLPGAGHFLLDECPDTVLRTLLPFLRADAAPA